MNDVNEERQYFGADNGSVDSSAFQGDIIELK